MSYETIELVGGPAHGELRSWDGGNYLEVVEKPPFKVFEKSPIYFTKHTYRRITGTGTFEYIGADK